MCNHMDGIMWTIALKKTHSKEDLHFAPKFVQQQLSKYYAEVTPTTGMSIISVRNINPFKKL